MVAQWAEFGGNDAGVTVQRRNETTALLFIQIFGYMHNNLDSMSRFVF
jgi:hypothetical protein